MKKCTCGFTTAEPRERFCPNCGKKLFSPSGVVIWGPIVAIFVLAILIIAHAPDVGNSSADTQASSHVSSYQSSNTVSPEIVTKLRVFQAASALQDTMRNPSSFRLVSALAMSSGAVCYEYRAQNGFGGMNVGYAVLTPDGELANNESGSHFYAWWKKYCRGKRGIQEVVEP